MNRTRAREIAMHLIFEMGFQEFEEERLDERLNKEYMDTLVKEGEVYSEEPDAKQRDYICMVVKGVAGNREYIDSVIEKYSGRKPVYMSRMTVAILRLAIYEIRNVNDVPESAAIHEAVELAKSYDAEGAAKLINGTLRSFQRGGKR